MASDYSREIHGHDEDRTSDGELLAEIREEIAAIEAGDASRVAPWSTAEIALADLRVSEATYREPRAYGYSGGEDFARGT